MHREVHTAAFDCPVGLDRTGPARGQGGTALKSRMWKSRMWAFRTCAFKDPSSVFVALVIACACIAGWPGPRSAAAQPADMVLLNGKIVAVDHKDGIYEAMAVRGGRILRLGAESEILALAGSKTETIDLEGRTVLPGLIDSHTHALEAALAEFDHRVPTMNTIAEVLAYIEDRAATSQAGEWIVLQQIFLTRLKERRYPTRAELDRAAPDHPVLFRTGSEALLNSMGLERMGIDADFVPPEGSQVERDSRTGELTGIVREWRAVFSIPEVGPTPDESDKEEWMLKLIADYNSVGITAFADRRAHPDQSALYKRLSDGDVLTARIAISRYLDMSGSTDSIRSTIRTIARDPLRWNDPMVRLIGVKIFADGGMLSGSAYMLEPWGISEMYQIDDPSYRGLPLVTREKLHAAVRAALEEGLQFTAHAVGDAAVDQVVRAYAALADSLPPIAMRQTRPTVTHANFIGDEALDLMARYGILADVQPAWLYMDAAVLESHFGYERMKHFQRFRTLFDRGVIIGGGSDHMKKIGSFRSINPYNPFLGMATAVTRRARNYEGALHPEHALTRMEAIRMYTINNAFLLLMEDRTGSLEPGKMADFIVLDRDLLTVPDEEIQDVQVLRTYLGGSLVFAQE